jgi:D-citramalate synthase
MAWASQRIRKPIEVLTFVDGGLSIEWMKKAGAKVQNLLTKINESFNTSTKKTPTFY